LVRRTFVEGSPFFRLRVLRGNSRRLPGAAQRLNSAGGYSRFGHDGAVDNSRVIPDSGGQATCHLPNSIFEILNSTSLKKESAGQKAGASEAL
jgi:hypothetical protein